MIHYGGCYDNAKRKWKKSYGIRPVGQTTDGKTVVSGFDSFKMSETLGIPLDLVVDSIYSNGMVIDWLDFVETARSVGWTLTRIFFKIETALDDCCIDKKPIIDRIRLYITKEN
jgi:hypothetical protein